MFNPFQMLPFFQQGASPFGGFNFGQGAQNPSGTGQGGFQNPFGAGQGGMDFSNMQQMLNLINMMGAKQQPSASSQQYAPPPQETQNTQYGHPKPKIEYPFVAIDNLLTDETKLALLAMFHRNYNG